MLKEALTAVKTKVAFANYNLKDKAAQEGQKTAATMWANIPATSNAVDDLNLYEILEAPKERKGKIKILEGKQN